MGICCYTEIPGLSCHTFLKAFCDLTGKIIMFLNLKKTDLTHIKFEIGKLSGSSCDTT